MSLYSDKGNVTTKVDKNMMNCLLTRTVPAKYSEKHKKQYFKLHVNTIKLSYVNIIHVG